MDFRKVFYFIFLLCPPVAAQHSTDHAVFDASSGKPIPYCTVYAIDGSYGVASDSIGKFRIDECKLGDARKIGVSAPGYAPAQVRLPASGNAIIELHRDTTQVIQTGELKKVRRRTLKYGYPNSPSSLYLGAPVGVNSELALFIANPTGRMGMIQGVCYMLHKEGKPEVPFRIRAYENSQGRPGKDILYESVIVVGDNALDCTCRSLVSHRVSFPPEGCFLAIEWLNFGNHRDTYSLTREPGVTGLGPTIQMQARKGSPPLYRRINNGDWQKVGSIRWDGFTLTDVQPSVFIEVQY